MQATIYSHNLKIGIVDLKPGDVSMGHVYGIFIPDEAYYNEAQKKVWKINDGLEEWSILKLNAQLDNGCFLYAAGGITIDDMELLPKEPIRVDIAGIDIEETLNYFNNNQALFVEEPWRSLEINQKIAFENELMLELGFGETRSIFSFLKSKTKPHILTGSQLFAVCHHQGTDDVLFRIDKTGLDSKFAVVHLTWKSRKENPGYPSTKLYKDFDDFKYNRMREDKLEWEY